jgi:hypothetical protein
MRPAPFDHVGVIAGFAASRLVMLKALFTEMPFAGTRRENSGRVRRWQGIRQEIFGRFVTSRSPNEAEIEASLFQTIAGASTGGRRGALLIRSTAKAAASASMPAPTKAIV